MATKLSTFNATASTGTAASHYYVETADDGFIRPKALADVVLVRQTLLRIFGAIELGLR